MLILNITQLGLIIGRRSVPELESVLLRVPEITVGFGRDSSGFGLPEPTRNPPELFFKKPEPA